MKDVRSQKKRIGLTADQIAEKADKGENVNHYFSKKKLCEKEPSLAEINNKLDTILEHFRIQYPRSEMEG